VLRPVRQLVEDRIFWMGCLQRDKVHFRPFVCRVCLFVPL
jgi:hypothetical protein